MQNPIKEIREELGITINEMALKLGVSYMTYFRTEKGMNLACSPIIINRLEELGYDRDEIEQNYREWRESKAE